jgi:hypothetical protein
MTISAAHMHEDTHIDWSSLTPGTFWVTADKVQDDTLSHATEMFSALETVNEKALKEILIQYRYFTVYYITDLALLIAGMEDSPMRSFLADILYDELGCGKADGAHPRLYDDFLSSIGVRDHDLNALALRNNIELLDDARRHLVAAENGSDYGVGLRGMAESASVRYILRSSISTSSKTPMFARIITISIGVFGIFMSAITISNTVKKRVLSSTARWSLKAAKV